MSAVLSLLFLIGPTHLPYLACAEERSDIGPSTEYCDTVEKASRHMTRKRWGEAYLSLASLSDLHPGLETGNGAELLGMAEVACRRGYTTLGRKHFHAIDCATSYLALTLKGSGSIYSDFQGGGLITDECLAVNQQGFDTRLGFGEWRDERWGSEFDRIASVCKTDRRTYPSEAATHGLCKLFPDLDPFCL
ncbi:MAG: hypothetical protein AAF830_11180 [Pseudomonadota bacterium]